MGAAYLFSYSVALTLICFVTSSDLAVDMIRSSPCLYKHDIIYGGILVDCQGQGLMSLPQSDWIPPTTTSLLLQFNLILRLDKDCLKNTTELRFLSLANNNIQSIDPYALRYNSNLQVLNLEFNYINLNNHRIGGPLLYNLPNLIELRLNSNHNGELLDGKYSPTLLAGLSGLRKLTLDTFKNSLDFNGIFNETRDLTSLVLGGGLKAIRNESFVGFDSIKLKQLRIFDVPNFHTTDTGAFRSLKHLDTYVLDGCRQRTKDVLESLAPFVGRNFTLLQFVRIHRGIDGSVSFYSDSQISQHLARYLSQICVQQFVFKDNLLFFVEHGSFTSNLWSRCLISLDLSENPLLGEITELMHLMVMQSLKYIRIQNRKYCFLNTNGRNHPYYGHFPLNASNPIARDDDGINNGRENNGFGDSIRCKQQGEKELGHIEDVGISKFGVYKNETSFSNIKVKAKLTIFFPRNLEYFNVGGFSTALMDLSTDIHVVHGENLKEFYLQDSGISHFTGQIHGLGNVKVLDISKNDGTEITSKFLNSFKTVSTLNMAMMGLNKIFTTSKSQDIFKGLYNLEKIDLSNNKLYILPFGMFSSNNKLNEISLAGNRFTAVPIHFRHVPDLRILDVRANSFLTFSQNEITSLERHELSNPHNFYVLLKGNVFSCSCFSIRFLQWLQQTAVELDNGRNYSCSLRNGQITTTSNMKNVKGLWRQCRGYLDYLTSLIIMCFMALCFSIFFICDRFKTQIKAAACQYFNATFVLKTPQDYSVGVYIGYSDHDTNFACDTLRNFIEEELRFTTYVRHRDLIPATSMAESIVTAINASWRVVLVMTEQYLEDQWSYLAMKSATYSVGSTNPDRLVLVILSEQHVEYQIPSYVLTAVREKSIVKIRSGGDHLKERQAQALRAALLP